MANNLAWRIKCIVKFNRGPAVKSDRGNNVISLHRGFFVALLLLAASLSASASDVTWTLVDVTSLGTSITGTFTYNADTDIYSNIDVTSSGGSVIPSETWTNKASFGSFNCCLALVSGSAADQTGLDLLNLVWTPGELTDAGGSIPLTDTQQGTCASANCVDYTAYPGDPSGGQNNDVTGYLFAGSSTPTPEPASLLLLGSGMLGMVGLLRRRLN
jgi:PEP-CTERM motif